MTRTENRGLTLALPITLGLILLALIIVVVVVVFIIRGTPFDKLIHRQRKVKNKSNKNGTRNNLEKTKNDKNSSNNNNNNSSKQLTLFSTSDHPTTTSYGFLKPGDVYYEEQSGYQAGKWSREAVDLISDWLECCHVRDAPDGEPANEDEARVPVFKPNNSVQNIYPSLNRPKEERADGEKDKKRKKGITSIADLKQMSLVELSSDSLKKADKRQTFIAMYPLTSSSQDELNLLANDVIYYMGEKKDGWLKGMKKDSGDVGWFPRSYVREGVSQAPDTSMFVSTNDFDDEDVNDVDDDDDDDDDGDDDDAPLFECVVRHDYNAVHEGDMNLKKGDVVTVHETLDNGWWRGVSNGGGGGCGFFPGSYVQISENLTTRSCVNLSERFNVNGSEKRSSLGRQFIQKLSVLNLGPIKKKKIRHQSVKAMSRKPAPSPCRDVNFSFTQESLDVESNIPCLYVIDSSGSKSEILQNIDKMSDSDTIYGNLEPYAALPLPSKKSSSKPPLPPKQKILDASSKASSKVSSSTLSREEHKTPVDNPATTNISPWLSSDNRLPYTSTSSLRSLEVANDNNDNSSIRRSLNFEEELKNRVNLRLKADN